MNLVRRSGYKYAGTHNSPAPSAYIPGGDAVRLVDPTILGPGVYAAPRRHRDCGLRRIIRVSGKEVQQRIADFVYSSDQLPITGIKPTILMF